MQYAELDAHHATPRYPQFESRNTRLPQRAGEARKVQCKRCLRLRSWRATAFTCVRDNALALGITTAEKRSRTPQPDIRTASTCVPARGPLPACSCLDAVARGERAGLFTLEHSASVRSAPGCRDELTFDAGRVRRAGSAGTLRGISGLSGVLENMQGHLARLRSSPGAPALQGRSGLARLFGEASTDFPSWS
jgi:hypothetical protein